LQKLATQQPNGIKMILSYCPWCNSKENPEVKIDINTFGRKVRTYICKSCGNPWEQVGEEPRKIEEN
jgi:hypothetical protein